MYIQPYVHMQELQTKEHRNSIFGVGNSITNDTCSDIIMTQTLAVVYLYLHNIDMDATSQEQIAQITTNIK